MAELCPESSKIDSSEWEHTSGCSGPSASVKKLLSSPTLTCQLQELLEAAGRLQKLSPLAFTAVQQKQQAVTQAWEALQLRVEQRKALLGQAYLLVRFHTTVRGFLPLGGVHVCADVYMH